MISNLETNKHKQLFLFNVLSQLLSSSDPYILLDVSSEKMPKSSHHHCSPTPTPTFSQSASVAPALENSGTIHPVTAPRKQIHPKSFCPLLPHLIQSPTSLPPKRFFTPTAPPLQFYCGCLCANDHYFL